VNKKANNYMISFTASSKETRLKEIEEQVGSLWAEYCAIKLGVALAGPICPVCKGQGYVLKYQDKSASKVTCWKCGNVTDGFPTDSDEEAQGE
jgi:Zn ribbon nucleic-acid-binding protein